MNHNLRLVVKAQSLEEAMMVTLSGCKANKAVLVKAKQGEYIIDVWTTVNNANTWFCAKDSTLLFWSFT